MFYEAQHDYPARACLLHAEEAKAAACKDIVHLLEDESGAYVGKIAIDLRG